MLGHVLQNHRGVNFGHPLQQCFVVRTVPRFVEVELLIKCLLVKVRQECDAPAQERLAVFANGGGWKAAEFGLRCEVVHCQRDLLEIVDATLARLRSISACLRRCGGHRGFSWTDQIRPTARGKQACAGDEDPSHQNARGSHYQFVRGHCLDYSFGQFSHRARDQPGRHCLASRDAHRDSDRGFCQSFGHRRRRGAVGEARHGRRCYWQSQTAPGQPSPQELPGPRHPDADRADRTFHQPSRIGMGPAFQVAKNHGCTIFFWQSIHFFVQHLDFFSPKSFRRGEGR